MHEDAGRRRYLCLQVDFDTRAFVLEQNVNDDWDENAKQLWERNVASIRESLKAEYGERRIEIKTRNFRKMGTKPFSILSYHNKLFQQIRHAYVVESYYPALVSACALGERILNHLMIDLREFYSHTPEFKKVYRKKSFDDWDILIDTLEVWGVLLPEVVVELRGLKTLRHRSIHFNSDTYRNLEDDALLAITHLRSVIEHQFSSFGARPWIIPGTKGHAFIRKEFENDPFVKTYFLPNCPFVGPLFCLTPSKNGWQTVDMRSYGVEPWSDEEFADEFNERDPEKVVKPTDGA